MKTEKAKETKKIEGGNYTTSNKKEKSLKSTTNINHFVFTLLWHGHRVLFLKIIILYAISALCSASGPSLFKWCLECINKKEKMLLAFSIKFLVLLLNFTLNMEASRRNSLLSQSIFYHLSLGLYDQISFKSNNSGRLINMLMMDIKRISIFFDDLEWFVRTPIVLPTVLYGVFRNCGFINGLAGITMMSTLPLFQYFLFNKSLIKLRLFKGAISDTRVTMTREFTLQKNFIELHKYKSSFIHRLMKIRGEECRVLFKMIMMISASVLYSSWCPMVASTIGSFGFKNIDEIFFIMASFSMFTMIMSGFVSMMNSYSSLRASFLRLFLFNNEKGENMDKKDVEMKDMDKKENSPPLINLKNIENLNFKILCIKKNRKEENEDETENENDKINDNKNSIEFISRNWIFPGTVMENICMGMEFDAIFYEKVLNTCQLLGEIDERYMISKSSLSGGQCQRISLARQLYQKSKVIILNDLFWIDSKTKSLIMSELLSFENIKIIINEQNENLKEYEYENEYEYEDGNSNNCKWSQMADVILENGKIFSIKNGKFNENDIQVKKENDLIPSIEQDQREMEINEKDHYERENHLSFLSLPIHTPFSSTSRSRDKNILKSFSINDKDEKASPLKIQIEWQLTPLYRLWISYLSHWKDYFLASIVISLATGGESFRFTKEFFAIWILNHAYGSLVWIGFTILQGSLSLASDLVYASMHTGIVKRLYLEILEKIDNQDSSWYTTDLDIVDEKLAIRTFKLFLFGGQMIFGIKLLYSVLSQIYILWILAFIALILYVFVVEFRPRWQGNHYDLSFKRNDIIANWNDIAEGIQVIQSNQSNISYFRNKHQNKMKNLQNAAIRRIKLSIFIKLWIKALSLIAIYGILFIKVFKGDYKSMKMILIYGQSFRLQLISFMNSLIDIEANLCYLERIKRQVRFLKPLIKKLSPISIHSCIRNDNESKNDNHDCREVLIDIKDLSLDYCKIKNFHLQITRGSKIAIMGRTGIGKTSLIMVLSGLEESYKGDVLINEISISNLEMSNILSLVPQNPIIWSGTIRFNIDPNDVYSDDQIWTVLKQVELASFIQNLKLKLKTIMTSAAFPHLVHPSLSKDEKNTNNEKKSKDDSINCPDWTRSNMQLLCLSRALIRDRPILLLDEATSNLDADLDSKINKILVDKRDLTVISIVHRLESTKGFDQIIEIK